MCPQAGYEAVTLSTSLLDRVRRVVKARPELGYVTPTEYVRDAIRRSLDRDEPTMRVEKADAEDVTVRRDEHPRKRTVNR